MSKEILVKFGKEIRKQRLIQRISQEELAERAGLHRTYIGMIERGEKNVTLVNIHNVAKGLKLKLSYIFLDF